MEEQRFIIKVLEMFYNQGMSQIDISKKLNVSNATISRTLTKARKEGYIRVVINYPDGITGSFEPILEEKYGLKEVMIASGKSDQGLLEHTSRMAADFLIRNLRENQVIAVMVGRSVSKTIECLKEDSRIKFMELQGINVVPLAAVPHISDKEVDYDVRMWHSVAIIDEMAKILNAESYHIPAPLYLESSKIKDLLMQETVVKQTFDMIEKADIALVGIGMLERDDQYASVSNLIPLEEFKKMKEDGGTGEINGCPFDQDGIPMHGEYDKHVMGISLEEFMKIPVRIGVAYGESKKEAIKAALKGRLINVLITDDKVADYLAEEK